MDQLDRSRERGDGPSRRRRGGGDRHRPSQVGRAAAADRAEEAGRGDRQGGADRFPRRQGGEMVAARRRAVRRYDSAHRNGQDPQDPPARGLQRLQAADRLRYPQGMSTETIPVIDLGPYLAVEPGAIDRTAKELRFALTEIGFYFIVNHGIPREKIRATFDQV